MSAMLKRRWLMGTAGFLALGIVALLAQHTRAKWPFAERSVHASHSIHEEFPSPLTGTNPHAGMEMDPNMNMAAAAGSVPSGYAPISIDPSRKAALQLASAPVEDREFTRVVRSVGVVTLDETRSAHVHSKVRGWIDGIFVDFVGRKVKAGEPLCSIYSQEVYSAEIEFVSILNRSSNQPDPLLDAARRRLSLWDVPKSEVERLEATREPRRTFPLLAPRAGVVISKEAIQGMFVDSALELYTLSDLSRLWVLVDVYDVDVPYVHVGDHAGLTIEGVSASVDSKVAFLAPTIDEPTRTRKVRFELDNKDGRLLPGAFASAELTLSLGRGLAVPESAVIRTGARSIVFVSHGKEGEHLEPREIVLGPLVGDRYRVQSGLSAGERVATGAQFLLDSESRLRATSGPAGAHVH